MEEHLIDVECVLKSIEGAELRLKPGKCTNQVDYVGPWVTN